MKAEVARFMWLVVFFDLPVRTREQRRHASRFRIFLKNDGFLMLQFSVYACICRGDDGAQKHNSRIRANLPKEGSVRSLQLTDRQFGRMELMLGEASKTEKVGPTQMVLL